MPPIACEKVRAQERSDEKPSIFMHTIFHEEQQMLVFHIVKIVKSDTHIKPCVLLYDTAQ